MQAREDKRQEQEQDHNLSVILDTSLSSLSPREPPPADNDIAALALGQSLLSALDIF